MPTETVLPVAPPGLTSLAALRCPNERGTDVGLPLQIGRNGRAALHQLLLQHMTGSSDPELMIQRQDFEAAERYANELRVAGGARDAAPGSSRRVRAETCCDVRARLEKEQPYDDDK